MSKMTWYDKGFEEGLADLPADPPMHTQHASHRNYMEGYLDGVRQLRRNVERAEAQ